MRMLLLLTCLALLLPLSLACGGNDSPKRLTIDDAGTTVKVGNSDTFQVTLAGNPTTGYTWEAENLDQSILEQQGDWEFKPESSAVGAGGTLTATFKAIGVGATTLRLIYHRTFEPNVAPLKTWDATVEVGE